MAYDFDATERRKRRASNDAHKEQAMELRGLCERLAELMEASGGKSAMVRTYVDGRTGERMCAANLYGSGNAVGCERTRPLVEIREEVGAWRK